MAGGAGFFKEARKLNKSSQKGISEMYWVRRIDKTRNYKIRNLGAKSAKKVLENQKLYWFSHLVRKKKDKQIKNA